MGIRIHKAIGYGLNDLQNYLEDDRFSSSDWIDDIYEIDFNGFKKFLQDKDECVEVLVNEFAMSEKDAEWDYNFIEMFLNDLKCNKKQPYPTDFFSTDHEDESNWILFYPAGHTRGGQFDSWYRYDDPIDYYENRVYKKELESIIIDLSENGTRGLHPYHHAMHLKPGRENKIINKFSRFFEARKRENFMESGYYNQLVGKWDGRNAEPIVSEEMVKHLEEDWCPTIPVSIKLFVHYFKIFKNPHTVYDLKPLLCQWWG